MPSERVRWGVTLGRSPTLGCSPYLREHRLDLRIGYVQVPAEFHDTPPRLSLSTGLTGLPAAAMTAPTFSVAARNGSSWKWLYLAVVRGLVCPSSAPISGSDAPPLTSCEA